MYKNRARGLKRAASALRSTTSSSSNLGPEEASQKKAANQQSTSAPDERVKLNAGLDVEEDEDDRLPHAKKPHIPIPGGEKNNSQASPARSKSNTNSQPKPKPSRLAKERPRFLSNHVDIDANTMCMAFRSKFEELVTKSGFKLQDGAKPFLLTKDQAVFVRNLTILLSEKDDNTEEFLEGFEKYIENNENFKKMLIDTQTDPDFEDARSSEQDSLIRMLLCVDSIQPQVIVFLFKKLVALIQRDKKDRAQDPVPWVEIIVKRLRFLDQLVDGTSLFNDIFRIIEVAPTPVQQEIIYNMPYIMGHAHHDEVAERLLNLMESKRGLTGAVLQALGSLPLSPNQSAGIRTQMLQSLKSAPLEFIPSIVKFVALEDQCMDHDEIINGLRNSLPFTRLNEKLLAEKAARQGEQSCDFSSEFASTISLTFRFLRGAFLSIRPLASAWCRNIKGILSANDHRPIDIMMLSLMHCKASNRRKQVELVWLNRIKTKMFTHALLEETFAVLMVVLKKHKDDVLNVASTLLRNSDVSVREYGRLMYKLSFVHFESHIRRQVVSDLMLHVGSGSSCAQVALDILLELTEEHLDKLCRLTSLLQNLLDNMDGLNLQGVGQLMNLLCKMAYAQEVVESGAADSLGDSISIIVQKQLASFEPLLKRKGVVSAVMMLKYMAGVNADSSSVCANSSSFDSLPSGRPKEAGQLLDLVMKHTRSNPEALGYCLDQFSFMIYRCGTLDPSFLQHFVDKMEDKFMASYLPDDNGVVPSRGGGLELRMKDQYCLDKDSDEPIALGVGILVLKDARNSKDGSVRQALDNTYPLLVLNPLFRLLRVLKFRTGDENLEGIDALLGCAVNMPTHETIVDFNLCGPTQQADIVDCLFHCVNWFREIINAFANTKSLNYLEKVMIRLRNLVALQSILARLLANTVNYTPPQCMFYDKLKKIQFKAVADKVKKKGKAKKGSKKKINESAAIDESTHANGESDGDKDEEITEPIDLLHYRNFLRELDLDVFGLMKQDLVMTPPPERGADSSPDFGPSELRFLLEDYVTKMEHTFPTSAVNRFAKLRPGGDSVGNFAVWDLLPITEKATNAVSMLPILCEKLEQIGESCRNLLDVNDGIVDGPGMFLEGSANVKICFGLLFRALSSTFSWNGFHHSQNSDLLSKGLKVLATRLDAANATKKRSSVLALISEAADYLKRFHEWILHFDAAVHLVKLLQILGVLWDISISRSSSRQNHVNPIRNILKEVCGAFLRRPWSTLDGRTEKGTAYTVKVEVLARVYFESIEDKLDFLEELVPKLYKESKELTSKDSSFQTFPSISKYNFYVLTRVMYSTLAKGIQAEMSKNNESLQQMKAWATVFKVLEGMVDITQKFTARSYLAAMLKHGQSLLKLYSDKGMLVLEGSLRNNTEEVMAILRSSQVTTRFINKICLSCKTSQDSALTALVPQMRETMETLLYRVKAMLALNNIESAWHMGNLRNRDVHNVELSTQESNEDDESEEVPEAEEERDADVTALDSGSEDEDRRVKGKKKHGRKPRSTRRSASGSENEEEESEDDSGDNTSVSTAY